MKTKATTGFTGLEYMGSRLARRLLDHSYRVNVFNRNPAKTRHLVRAGARAFETVAELAPDSDILLSCLVDGQAIAEVFEGKDGALTHAKPATTIIEMSTVSRKPHGRSERMRFILRRCCQSKFI